MYMRNKKEEVEEYASNEISGILNISQILFIKRTE